jgi:hypothetical protein
MGRLGVTSGTVLALFAASLLITSCSTAATDKHLAISAQGDVPTNLTGCTLNGSDTQAVASGTFQHPLQYPSGVTPGSTRPGAVAFQLRLTVENGDAKVFGVKSRPIELGATSWTITSSVKAGSKPTECVVSIQSTSD